MGKRQTRRAVTVRPEIHDRLVAHCSAPERSVSGFVEMALADLSTVDVARAQQATADAAARSRGRTHRGPGATCPGRVTARYARICHCSIAEAARVIGVDDETARKWWHKLYPGVPTNVKRRRRLRVVSPMMEIVMPVLNRRPARSRPAPPVDPPIPFWLLPTGPVRK